MRFISPLLQPVVLAMGSNKQRIEVEQYVSTPLTDPTNLSG